MNRSTGMFLVVAAWMVMMPPLLVMASTEPAIRPPAPHEGQSYLVDSAIVELKVDVVSLSVPPEVTFHSRSELLSTVPEIERTDILGILVPHGEPVDGEDTWWIMIELTTGLHVPMTPLPEPAAMLQQIQNGYEQEAQRLSDTDSEAIQFIALLQPPQLDPKRHVLTWAEEVKVGRDPLNEALIFALVFGRDGIVEYHAKVPILQQEAAWSAISAAAGNTAFAVGERYEDFQEGTSKLAQVELADIVTGRGSLANESLLADLTFRSGRVTVGDNLATLNLPDGYRYLDPKDSRQVIVDTWANPPEMASDVLGMVLPAGMSPLDDNAWGAVITYEDSGHVDDSDASTMDYDALLSKMKADTIAENEDRERRGYPTSELIDWARPPGYDTAHHALIWAKELRFGDQMHHTLNYDLRILGRTGVLSLNAVSSMSEVSSVRAGMHAVLDFTRFNAGKRYEDFKPGEDKVSDLGIATLILGGTAVAAKSGLLKGLLLAILAFKKLVIVGLAGLWIAIRKRVARRKSDPTNSPGTTPALEQTDD
ncbi:MAG TPA: DUF2167 domain-containing protein [Anaerolineae bacterium]|nr:DUF2167 domain-containing protein [Anaerolineae bacterium]